MKPAASRLKIKTQHNPATQLLCSDRNLDFEKAMAMTVPGKRHHPGLQNPAEPQVTVCTALGQSHDNDHENDDDQGSDNESHN
ncbi:MAG: hypothetical protein ACYDAI_15605 [Trichloromonadaceae bacterium]